MQKNKSTVFMLELLFGAMILLNIILSGYLASVLLTEDDEIFVTLHDQMKSDFIKLK